MFNHEKLIINILLVVYSASMVSENVSWGSLSGGELSEVVRGAEVVEFLELLGSDSSVSVGVNLVKDIVELGLGGDFNAEVVAGRPDVLSVEVAFEVGVVSVEGSVAGGVVVGRLVDSGDTVVSILAILRGDSASEKVGVGRLELVVFGHGHSVSDMVGGVLGETVALAAHVR